MARSAYKGFFFCNKTLKVAYQQKSQTKPILRYTLLRSSDIPNIFANVVGRTHAGRGPIKFIMRATSATRKAGSFLFNRKPFVFPNKKRRKVN